MFLGKPGGIERSPLDGLLATDILSSDVEAVTDRLPVQEEEVAVRL